MADWAAIENGVAEWVRENSGLAVGQFGWSYSNIRRPDHTFITMEAGEVVGLAAQDEVNVVDHTGDVSPPDAGAEIELQAIGLREFGLTLQCFAPPSGSPAVPRGSSSPRAVLSKLQTALALPSVADKLSTAGLSCYDRGSIRYVPAIAGTEFEGRAILELRFYVTDTASEFTSYIDTVKVNDPADPDTPDTTNDTIDI